MKKHIAETELALFASGELNVTARVRVGWHVRSCERCAGRVEAYRGDRLAVREEVLEMPAGVDWDRLSREMTGNIRVGLAAGECVAVKPASRKNSFWLPAGIPSQIGLSHLQARVRGQQVTKDFGLWLVEPDEFVGDCQHALKTIVRRNLLVLCHCIAPLDRKSTRLNSSHVKRSRMPSSA